MEDLRVHQKLSHHRLLDQQLETCVTFGRTAATHSELSAPARWHNTELDIITVFALCVLSQHQIYIFTLFLFQLCPRAQNTLHQPLSNEEVQVRARESQKFHNMWRKPEKLGLVAAVWTFHLKVPPSVELRPKQRFLLPVFQLLLFQSSPYCPLMVKLKVSHFSHNVVESLPIEFVRVKRLSELQESNPQTYFVKLF